MPEVETARDGAVLTVTLNRPDVLNALNAATHKALGVAFKEARSDEVRAVVLTGAGRSFCVGQDLSEFKEGGGDIGARLRGNYHPTINAIRSLEKPVIAAVNGAAAGAGLSLACACDLRIASDAATFVPAFVNIGLVPDGGSTFLVPVAAGKARALEMALLGDPIPASQALEWGLINRVVPDGDLLDDWRKLARRLAAGPTRSYANSKRALNNSMMRMMDEQLDLEAQIQGEMTNSTDFIEGISAFVQKREPSFTGG